MGWVRLAEWVRRMNGLTPGAFGSAHEQEAQSVFDVIPPAPHESRGSHLVHYGPFERTGPDPSKVMLFPDRVYNEPLPERVYHSLSPTQRLLTDCWYSRSHDGHLRERSLRRITQAEEQWIVPYVFAALGDYVVEVAQEVAAGLTEIEQPLAWQRRAYRDFAEHNYDFFDLTRQRATSYWNEYYRATYSRGGEGGKPTYPAFPLLDQLDPIYPRFYRLDG